MTPTTIKTTGYLVSTVSVILLGIVSWDAASRNPMLMGCLICGMAASILGMFLRWQSYRIEERERGR